MRRHRRAPDALIASHDVEFVNTLLERLPVKQWNGSEWVPIAIQLVSHD